jgi:hypothetical protein
MTVTKHRSGRRCGTEARFLAAGVLACGAVLLPAGAAFGSHMPMPDGTMCPHAAGNLENPATSDPPSRTSASEAPLGAASSTATRSAPRPAARPAPAPAAKAPVQRAVTRAPASTRAAAPATTAAKRTAAAPAVRAQRAAAPVAQVRRAVAPVAQPRRATAPVAKQSKKAAARPSQATASKRTAPTPSASTPKVSPALAPEFTLPSAADAPQLVAQPTGAAPAEAKWTVGIGGLLVLIVSAVAVAVLRRRGSGGDTTLVAREHGPIEPTTTVDEFEVALQEMLAEARAEELLGTGGREADAGDHPAPLERQ